ARLPLERARPLDSRRVLPVLARRADEARLAAPGEDRSLRGQAAGFLRESASGESRRPGAGHVRGQAPDDGVHAVAVEPRRLRDRVDGAVGRDDRTQTHRLPGEVMRDARIAAVASCLAVVALAAQQPAQQRPVFRGGTNMVRVDAYPTERDGTIVEGLT